MTDACGVRSCLISSAQQHYEYGTEILNVSLMHRELMSIDGLQENDTTEWRSISPRPLHLKVRFCCKLEPAHSLIIHSAC